MKDAYTRIELASLVERFLDGNVGPYEWDDFTSIKRRDTDIESCRLEIVQIADRHPSQSTEQWCSEEGIEQLRRIAERLRGQG